MTKSILIVLYTIFLIITTYNLIREYRIKKVINATISFQVAFIIYYIIIPIFSLILIDVKENDLSGMLLRISGIDDIDFIYAFCFTVIFYVFFVMSYKVKFSRELKPRQIQSNKTVKLNERLKNSIELDNRVYKTAVFWGTSCLLLGLFAQYLIVDSLGGILNTAIMGDKLRAFGTNTNRYIPDNRLFALTLMPIVLAAPYFFMYAKRIKKSFSLNVLIGISLLSSILFFSLNAGRIAILVFILTFFLDFAFRKTKHPYTYIFMISIASLILLGFLDDLFFYLSYGFVKENTNSGIVSIVNEFAFPYLNLQNVISINEKFGFRLGLDFITWIVNIIPYRILQIFGLNKLQTGYHFITEYYLGENAGGGIPTDLITFGMRQFGMLGTIITPLIFGRIIRYFDRIIEKVHDVKFYFISLRVSSIAFLIVPYADIDSFIRNRFDMFIVLAFLIVVSKLRLKNYKLVGKRERE